MTNITTLRYVFEGANLQSIINLLYSEQNLALATGISQSILKDKTFNALYIDPVRASIIREQLLDYLYKVYYSNFGTPSRQVELSNRMRAYSQVDVVKLYQEANSSFYTNQATFNRKFFNARTERPISLESQFVVRTANTLLASRDVVTREAVLKKTYVINPLYRTPTVFDLTEPQQKVRSRRITVKRNDNNLAVGIFYDPQIYDVVDFRLQKINGYKPGDPTQTLQEERERLTELEEDFLEETSELQQLFDEGDIGLEEYLENLTPAQLAQRDELISEGVLDPDEVNPELARSSTFTLSGGGGFTLSNFLFFRYSYDKTRARDILNALNGRVKKKTYALYLDAVEEERSLRPINLTFYSVNNTLTKEYLLPIFNTNQLESGYGYFNKDSARNFNIQNL